MNLKYFSWKQIPLRQHAKHIADAATTAAITEQLADAHGLQSELKRRWISSSSE